MKPKVTFQKAQPNINFLSLGLGQWFTTDNGEVDDVFVKTEKLNDLDGDIVNAYNVIHNEFIKFEVNDIVKPVTVEIKVFE